MRKVLSAQELSALLDGQHLAASLDAIVTPTADDLLMLTEAAIGDVEGVLPLTHDQREALRQALKRRLFGALANTAATEHHEQA